MNIDLGNGYRVSQLLGGRSNVLLVQSLHENIIIDSSKKTKRKKLVSKLNKLGINRIDWLLLTHTNVDHCGNAAFLQKKYECRVVTSKKAYDIVKVGRSDYSHAQNLGAKLMMRIASLFGNKGQKFDAFTPDLLVEEGFCFQHQNIEVLSTPGHSDESVSYVLNNKVVAVGDTLFGVTSDSVAPPLADNKELLHSSWEKLASIKADWYIPGHGKAIPNDLLKAQLRNVN